VKFLLGVKEIFDKPLEVKKKRYVYAIYKRIDANYYDNRDGENGILEKVERLVEEEMWARALRK
jgi:hypothetical protein